MQFWSLLCEQILGCKETKTKPILQHGHKFKEIVSKFKEKAMTDIFCRS